MNLNVKLDNDGPTSPVYSPTTNLRDGMDNDYILYQNSSLSIGSHTFAVSVLPAIVDLTTLINWVA